MTRILVTLDGSELSQEIIPAVVPLAQKLDGEVILLTVLPKPEGTKEDSPENVRETMPEYSADLAFQVISDEPDHTTWAENPEQAADVAVDEGRGRLTQAEANLRKAGVRVSTHVVLASDAAEAIVQIALRDSVDFIAMSTHGRGGLSRLIQGSVAAAVVSSSVAPVMLVRPHDQA